MVDSSPAFEAAKGLYGTAVKGLQELKWEHVSEPVRNYIQEHPKLSTLQLVLLLVVTCPGPVLTPMLGAVGFSSIGPVAGSYAAWYQSIYGATWAFSGLQSLAMGGRTASAGAMTAAVQGAAIAGGGISGWLGRGASRM